MRKRCYFNSRPSARGDNPRRRHARRHPYFNSRPSARGDRTVFFVTPTTSPFQFTPLREGRHAPPEAVEATPAISIHAPPRGATQPSSGCLRHRVISIHAPPRGATALSPGDPRRFPYFNSRPSARGDVRLLPLLRQESPISIHAPPRGATIPAAAMRGGTPISIHAPPRGATARLHVFGAAVNISIHAPPRGATAGATQCVAAADRFQFTPLREGRRQKICNFCKSFVQPLQISMA